MKSFSAEKGAVLKFKTNKNYYAYESFNSS